MTAKESSGLRAGKKLTGKSQWFRKDYQVHETESNMEEQVERCLDPFLKNGNDPEAGKTIRTRTLLFIEQTKGGSLAKRLREVKRRTHRMLASEPSRV